MREQCAYVLPVLAQALSKSSRVQWCLVRHPENREDSDKRLHGTWMLALFAFLFCHLEFFNSILCNERKQLNLNSKTVSLQLFRSLDHASDLCFLLPFVPPSLMMMRTGDRLCMKMFFFLWKFNYKVRSAEKAANELRPSNGQFTLGEKKCIPFQHQCWIIFVFQFIHSFFTGTPSRG